MSLIRALPWFVFAAVGARAYATFEPICTMPTDSVNFVWGPDTRGTMEILWSSLFTLVACTWTIHHPNVPRQRDDRDRGWRGDLRWGFRCALESAKLALVTVLAPELIISVAWDQRRIAKKVKRELIGLAEEDGVPWTLVHGHYAAMGGFVLRSNISESEKNPYHLTADDVIFLRKEKHLRLPYVLRDEINDKSKSDPLLKIIAICQISWSVIQIVSRVIRHLSISLLELNVLALAACAIFIYFLCWDKPKNVQVAITIQKYETEIPEIVRSGLEQPEMSAAWVILFDTAEEWQIIKTTHPKPGAPLSNTRVQFNQEKSGVAVSLFLAATLFGAVHAAGWDLEFPTQAEQTIWRCAILYILTLPCFIIFLHLIMRVLLGKVLRLAPETIHPFLGLGGTLLCWVYLIARMFILVETVRTFVSLPPSAFVSTWTVNIPHFS